MDAAAAARLRAAGELAAVVVRASREDFAASPRAVAAFADAAREADVRFEGAGAAVCSPEAGSAAWASGDGAVVFAEDVRGARGFLAAAGLSAAAVFAAADPAVDPDFGAERFAVPAVSTTFGVSSGVPGDAAAAASIAVGRLEAVFAEPVRLARTARGALDAPRSADTPVPVPSGASSS